MLETSARLLKLLSLLQTRRDWTGAELASRLDVTTRTIRNDVERLRGLGYPVHATPGVAGGYRLGAGASLPPLLLADVLTAIASTCRDHERLRFDYLDHQGGRSVRNTEPHRLVHTGRRWYLVAWDLDRDDWRTFRVDRIEPRTPTGPRFTPRPLPEGGDVAKYVSRGLGTATWRFRARVIVHAPAAYVAARLPVPAEIQPLGEDRCVFEPGSDNPEMLAMYLGMLGADFTIEDSPELATELRNLAERYLRAITPPAAPPAAGRVRPSP